MNKIIKGAVIISAATLFLVSCNNNNPRKRGIEAGKAACECYKLEDFEAVDSCMKRIEQENAEYLNDTAYINAMEEQFIRYITEGVNDIVKQEVVTENEQ